MFNFDTETTPVSGAASIVLSSNTSIAPIASIASVMSVTSKIPCWPFALPEPPPPHPNELEFLVSISLSPPPPPLSLYCLPITPERPLSLCTSTTLTQSLRLSPPFTQLFFPTPSLIHAASISFDAPTTPPATPHLPMVPATIVHSPQSPPQPVRAPVSPNSLPIPAIATPLPKPLLNVVPYTHIHTQKQLPIYHCHTRKHFPCPCSIHLLYLIHFLHWIILPSQQPMQQESRIHVTLFTAQKATKALQAKWDTKTSQRWPFATRPWLQTRGVTMWRPLWVSQSQETKYPPYKQGNCSSLSPWL